MKSDETELRHIKKVIYDCAVSRPGVSLSLISDGKEIFSFRKCVEKEEMLTQIFGDTFARMMVPFFRRNKRGNHRGLYRETRDRIDSL